MTITAKIKQYILTVFYAISLIPQIKIHMAIFAVSLVIAPFLFGIGELVSYLGVFLKLVVVAHLVVGPIILTIINYLLYKDYREKKKEAKKSDG